MVSSSSSSDADSDDERRAKLADAVDRQFFVAQHASASTGGVKSVEHESKVKASATRSSAVSSNGFARGDEMSRSTQAYLGQVLSSVMDREIKLVDADPTSTALDKQQAETCDSDGDEGGVYLFSSSKSRLNRAAVVESDAPASRPPPACRGRRKVDTDDDERSEDAVRAVVVDADWVKREASRAFVATTPALSLDEFADSLLLKRKRKRKTFA